LKLALAIFLLLAIIIFASKWAGALASRYHQPAVFGEILIGVLLGPTLINLLGWPIFQFHGSNEVVTEFVVLLAEVGVLLLMFVAGLETDFNSLLKVGRPAFWGAIGGVLGPFLLGFGIFLLFAGFLGGERHLWFTAIFVGTILTATSVSISAQTLIELGKLRTRPGLTILGAAVIDDILGILILSLVVAFAPSDLVGEGKQILHDYVVAWIEAAGVSGPMVSILSVVTLVIMMVAFFVLGVILFRTVALRFVKWFGQLPVSEGLLAGALVVALLYGWAAEFLGSVAAITGSYMFGLLIANFSNLREEIEPRLHSITYSLFVPIFFVSIGLMTDLRTVFLPAGKSPTEYWAGIGFALLVVFFAIISKIGGVYIGAVTQGMKKLEAFQASVGMVSRGEVGLIIASIGLSSGVIDSEIFSVMVFMVLITTLVTPPLLRWAFSLTPPNEKNGGDGGSPSGEAPPTAVAGPLTGGGS